MSGIFMHRFFLPELPEQRLHITNPDLIHQIRRVFRAKIGESFIFFSVWTSDIVYEITDLSDKKISFLQKEVLPPSDYSAIYLTVFQAYPHKNETLELVVQKLVELGVRRLVLFNSERSQKNGISSQKKLRIGKIAQEALEQSGGNLPLEIIYSQENMVDIFRKNNGTMHIVGHPHDENFINPNISVKNIWFWVGPEGGWSPAEEEFFHKNTFTLWKFNEHILRLETASIAWSALLLYLAR